jgi:DNA-binding NtrC family response regulator
MKQSLLVDRDQQRTLYKALESAGFLVFDVSEDGRDRDRLRQLWAAVILLDLRPPRMRGLAIVSGLPSGASGNPEAIIATHGSILEALTAVRLVVADALVSPLSSQALRVVIDEIFLPAARPQPGSARPLILIAVEPTIIDVLRAKQALDRREFDRAERLVRSALDRHPDSAVAQNLMGVLHV